MKVALVGLGRWGSRLVPKLLNNPRITGVSGYDPDEKRQAAIAREFPALTLMRKPDHLYDEVDAAVIATPVASHYGLARQALEKGKHVLLEKPLTRRLEEAGHIVELARRQGLILMVDHITVYGGYARAIKELIAAPATGRLIYIDAVRANLGMLQRDVNVVWDLAVHEFALLDHLLGEMPCAVSAIGAAYHGDQEELAYITLFYGTGVIAHISVSWLSPVKVRRLVIGGTGQTVIYDDTAAIDKLVLSTAGIDVSEPDGGGTPRIEYRPGRARAVDVTPGEPMVLMLDEFIDSVEARRSPMTDGAAGWRTVKLLTAAEESIRQQGARIRLD